MKPRLIKLGIWWSDGRPRKPALSGVEGSSRAGTPGSPPASIKIGRHGALVTALSMALAISSLGGQIVDRVVTSVNGHVVLQSDWEQELDFEAFSNARDSDSFTSAARNAALDRLIDQELLREQVRPSQPAPAELVAAQDLIQLLLGDFDVAAGLCKTQFRLKELSLSVHIVALGLTAGFVAKVDHSRVHFPDVPDVRIHLHFFLGIEKRRKRFIEVEKNRRS